MTARSATTWGAALVLSGGSHGLAVALYLLLHDPAPPPTQPSPHSSLQMQAHRIPRSQAVAQPTQGDAAAETRPSSTGLAAGAPPRSRARPLPAPSVAATAQIAPTTPMPAAAPQAASAASSRPDTTAIAAQTTEPASLPPSQAISAPAPQTAPRPTAALTLAQPAAVQLAAADARMDLTPARIPRAQAVEGLAPIPVALAPQSDPAPAARPAAAPTTAIPADAPAGEATAPLAPPSSPALSRDPDPQVLDFAPPQAPRITATLAFAGGAGAEIDPQSLAAFQSFTRPGDLSAGADPLRDGMAGILAAVPCARLQLAFDPDTATLDLRGHLPEDGLRPAVLAALQDQMGADIRVSDNMRLLPRPQCGALAGIADVGLPQSTDQITNPLLIGADAQARVLDYGGGDRLFFDLTAPDYPAHVYVDFFDAGGSVLHLVPNTDAPLTRSAPASRLRVGAKAAGDPGLHIQVAPPYGQEIAVAFAASHPLYDGLRPLSEPAAPYLDWLKQQVQAARDRHPDFKGEWVYFLVTTHAP